MGQYTDRLNYFDSLIGQEIGDYHIDDKLGTGGMGAVFRATHRENKGIFALKVISPDFATNKTFIKRFKREARVGEVLSHPNIIKVFEYGETAQGLLFMVMEFVEGETLRKFLSSVRRINPKDSLEILRPLCLALEAAHKRNILHRDLKPANILINQHQQTKIVKLADFGIVKLLQADSAITEGNNLTAMGEVFGTPQYMSPEQLMGHTVGPATDIYSLGVITYEMLTGDLPVKADELRELLLLKTKNLEKPSKKFPFVPQEFDPILEKVMMVDAEERYQTPLDFFHSFEDVAAAFPTWSINEGMGEANQNALSCPTIVNEVNLGAVPTLLINNSHETNKFSHTNTPAASHTSAVEVETMMMKQDATEKFSAETVRGDIRSLKGNNESPILNAPTSSTKPSNAAITKPVNISSAAPTTPIKSAIASTPTTALSQNNLKDKAIENNKSSFLRYIIIAVIIVLAIIVIGLLLAK